MLDIVHGGCAHILPTYCNSKSGCAFLTCDANGGSRYGALVSRGSAPMFASQNPCASLLGHSHALAFKVAAIGTVGTAGHRFLKAHAHIFGSPCVLPCKHIPHVSTEGCGKTPLPDMDKGRHFGAMQELALKGSSQQSCRGRGLGM